MTNKEKVLNYLEHHDGITSMEAFHNLNITRLAAVIFELIQDGVDIEKEHIVQKNNNGKIVQFTRYRRMVL